MVKITERNLKRKEREIYKTFLFVQNKLNNYAFQKYTFITNLFPGAGRAVLAGLSRMEGLREWDGDGMGMGTGTPFRDKPPPPRLSRKGGLRAGSSINAPLRDTRGGLSRKGVLSSLLYHPFYKIVLIVFFVFI